MIKTVYRSNRSFESKDKVAAIRVAYEVGEMKSSIGTVMSVAVDGTIIEVVDTFEGAMQSINEHWEQAKMEAVNKSVDRELKEWSKCEQEQSQSHNVSVSVCSCEMPAKIKGKNECWRCKKPFKEFLQSNH